MLTEINSMTTSCTVLSLPHKIQNRTINVLLVTIKATWDFKCLQQRNRESDSSFSRLAISEKQLYVAVRVTEWWSVSPTDPPSHSQPHLLQSVFCFLDMLGEVVLAEFEGITTLWAQMLSFSNGKHIYCKHKVKQGQALWWNMPAQAERRQLPTPKIKEISFSFKMAKFAAMLRILSAQCTILKSANIKRLSLSPSPRTQPLPW